jgi:hypothetical protein
MYDCGCFSGFRTGLFPGGRQTDPNAVNERLALYADISGLVQIAIISAHAADQILKAGVAAHRMKQRVYLEVFLKVGLLLVGPLKPRECRKAFGSKTMGCPARLRQKPA